MVARGIEKNEKNNGELEKLIFYTTAIISNHIKDIYYF